MKETRRLEIAQKRFTRSDLFQIGRIFLDEAHSAKSRKKRHGIEFELECVDRTSYTAEDMNHFSEGAEIDMKPAASVQFQFHNYEDGNSLDFSLRGGKYSKGEVIVRGEDREWVTEKFVRMEERIGSLSPSSSWFTMHPTLTMHIIAMGLGSIAWFLLLILYRWFDSLGLIEHEPAAFNSNFIRFVQSPGIRFITGSVIRWWLGFVLGAIPLRDWLLNAWPSVEFDTGPEHGKAQKIRRSRLTAFVTFAIIPLFASLIYDLLKSLW
jgi:hypothetical protein